MRNYARRRSRTSDSADDQWKLALWCEKHGLEGEATAHLVSVVRREPNHEAARKRLGYKRHGSRWVTDDQVMKERHEAAAQEKADRRWTSTLESLQKKLKHAKSSELAERSLSAIDDPSRDSGHFARLRQGSRPGCAIVGSDRRRAGFARLAWLAVYGETGQTRRVATEILKRRDPREFVGDLIALVLDPDPLHRERGRNPQSAFDVTH